MRKVLSSLAAAAVIGSFASGAGAVTFVEVVSGNSPYPDELTVVIDGNTIITPALFKCDVSGSACVDDTDEPTLSYADNFAVSLTDLKPGEDDEFIGGSFSFFDLGEDDLLYPRFLALKAGREFALFEIGIGEFTGTDLLNIGFSLTGTGITSAISNISFYDTQIPPGGGAGPLQPIPLPAAGWLLVTAIGGLGFLSRRRRQHA